MGIKPGCSWSLGCEILLGITYLWERHINENGEM